MSDPNASSPSLQVTLNTNKRVGRYTLVRRLAMGGMGEIFLTKFKDAKEVERVAAVKRILPNLCRNQEFVDYFLHEGRVASLLNHPNVVQTLELGRTTEGHYFIAMEYVSGTTLVRYLATALGAKRYLSIPLVAYLMLQMARALDHVHTRHTRDGQDLNIIHMDLAPHNMLVTVEGQLKIMDFGIARSTGLGNLPRRRDFRGRTSYLAPEQLEGAALDQRLDLFAVGVIMHEVLLGRPLFRAKDDEHTVSRILMADVPRPTQVREDCPQGLEEVIMKALVRDRDQRYQSAAEMVKDLEACIEGLGLELSPERFRAELFPLWESIAADEQQRLAELQHTPL